MYADCIFFFKPTNFDQVGKIPRTTMFLLKDGAIYYRVNGTTVTFCTRVSIKVYYRICHCLSQRIYKLYQLHSEIIFVVNISIRQSTFVIIEAPVFWPCMVTSYLHNFLWLFVSFEALVFDNDVDFLSVPTLWSFGHVCWQVIYTILMMLMVVMMVIICQTEAPVFWPCVGDKLFTQFLWCWW